MKIIERLTARFRARERDANAEYWRLLERSHANGGELSDKNLAAIEDLARSLGKDAARVAADVELLQVAADAAGEEEAAVAVQQGSKRLAIEAAQDEAQAAQLEDQARQLRDSAANKRERSTMLMEDGRRTRQQVADARRALAAAGRPADVAAAAVDARAAEIERLRGDLTNAKLGIGPTFSEGSSIANIAAIRARLAELGEKLEDDNNSSAAQVPAGVNHG